MQADKRFHLVMSSPGIQEITQSDRDWVLQQHKRIYMDEHGFNSSFEVLVAQVLDRFFDARDLQREAGWIAEAHGKRLGSIFCTRLDEEEAQLRLFFLVESARGQGLGRRLMETLIGFAKTAGYKRLRLWTHASHEEACSLYEAAGWRCIDSKPTLSFGKSEVVKTYVYRL